MSKESEACEQLWYSVPFKTALQDAIARNNTGYTYDELKKVIADGGSSGYTHAAENFNKGAPAAQSWYMRVDHYDDDFEKVISHSFINVDDKFAAVKAVIATALHEAEDQAFKQGYDACGVALAPEVEKLVCEAEVRGRIDELQQLLDTRDQEVDMDGQPTTKPYYIISGDGERYLIEQRLAALSAERGEE